MTQIYLGEKLLKNTDVKAICTASTGTIHIDEKYCKKQNIKVLSLKNDKHFLNQLTSTSDLAFGFLINAVRKIPQSTLSVSKGKWSYLDFKGRMIKNLQIGIIGYGRLGKIFTKYCLCFGSKVSVYDPFVKITNKKIKVIKNINKEIKKLDVLALHIHASKKNLNFINKKKLNLMKENIIIINTSRGEIIEENDLISFLKKNKKSIYFTDVLSREYDGLNKSKIFNYSKKNPNQVFITPHIGGMTIEGQSLAYHYSLNKLKIFSKK
jgi:D-3-phosphoglycerate dehydrogenase